MTNLFGIKNNLKNLWSLFSKQRQKQFWMLLVLMIVSSFIEVISISAVLPFLGTLVAPEHVYKHEFVQPIVRVFNITSPKQVILPVTIIFIISTIIAVIVRLILLYTMTRLSYAAGADMSLNIYRNTLYQDYAKHIDRNSSEIINGVITKTGSVIAGVFNPVLTLISSIILMAGIISVLLTINTAVALSSFAGFGVLYWAVVRYTHKKVLANGKCIADKSTHMIKTMQEGLGGIRDVLINGSQEYYCDLYRKSDLALRKATGDNVFINHSPRYVMEGVGILLITILAYSMLKQENGRDLIIPVLGALAIGAQKALPALQQIYGAINSIKGSMYMLEDILYLLNQPPPSYADNASLKPVKFNSEIKLENIGFRYSKDQKWILKHIDLSIKKGSRIGFVGKTGSGKSTLLDVIMGLLQPTEGSIFIDNRKITSSGIQLWQKHISHVPQDVFLLDGTIEENIAFGVPADMINHKKVVKVAKQAKIKDLIDGWPKRYKTFVGERGIKISGGQRQRIGIARALYRGSDVLVFDEATSALDSETEKEIMESIEGLGGNITILIIAHRVTSLKGCDKVVNLFDNNIKVENYSEFMR